MRFEHITFDDDAKNQKEILIHAYKFNVSKTIHPNEIGFNYANEDHAVEETKLHHEHIIFNSIKKFIEHVKRRNEDGTILLVSSISLPYIKDHIEMNLECELRRAWRNLQKSDHELSQLKHSVNLYNARPWYIRIFKKV